MKRKFIKLLIVSMLLQTASGTVPASAAASASSYSSTWASVNSHNPAPEWFQDAKFGLWYHWGAFSVPAYGSEWYPRNMYNSGSGEYRNHTSVYGDPYTSWPYHNFLNGANNKAGVYTKFAPKLKSQGGNFDPDEWAQLFYDAGAKMAGPVSEHHDGFSMWDSTCNEWNSVKKGPGLDLTGLFAKAFRAKGMKFLVSTHTAYNFTGYYQYVKTQTDSSLKKLYGQLSTAEEEKLWLDKEKELIDLYQPDYMWHDFNVAKISEKTRLDYLSYYYNKANEWGKEVVVSYNDGFNKNGEVQQVERGGYADTTYPYWLCEDSVSQSSWCYTKGIGYYSGKAILDSLIDRVSKNGCLLLNLAPMADGSIPEEQKKILKTMGDWLKKYGEAIYSTRAWDKYGEGPSQLGKGGFSKPVEGKAEDIRFTRNKANTALYAIAMGWPSNNQMVISSLKTGSFDASKISAITFVNGGGNCTWTQDGTGLKVNLPSNLSDSMGYAVKIALKGSGFNGVTFYQNYDYAGSPVTLTPGSYTTAQLAAAGISNNSVSSIKVPDGMTVEVYNDDNFGGTKWTFKADSANFGNAGCNDAMTSVKILDSDIKQMLGDVNEDSKIDALDMGLIKKYLLGSGELSKTGLANADVNKDGAVDALDMVLVKKYILGVITAF